MLFTLMRTGSVSLGKFNLSKRLPQVVFVGNGLVYDSDMSWKELIKQTARDGVDVNRYINEQKEFKLPNTILTFVTADNNDKCRHKKYISIINDKEYKRNEHINELLKLPIDAFLTTNYTYEIEYAINNNYPRLSNKGKCKFSECTADNYGKGKVDARYLIHTYNKFDEFPSIWHIHGEARRKSSLILSHDEYARLVNKILEFNTKRKNDYEKFRNEIKIKSWIDYFILGDIYIIGCGFDFAEFDLWWLINRKNREKSITGKIYFYEPIEQKNKYKHMALKDVGVEVLNLDTEIFDSDSDEEINDKFQKFYSKAIEDIEIKIQNKLNK